MLQFNAVTLENLGPFTKRIDVDFTTISGMLIALTGPNGAGKTTFLECMTSGALYRKTPSRGALVELATKRGAYVETSFVNGHAYKIRQTVDPISGKGESLVTDEWGKPVLPSAKVSEFDGWSRDHMPPPSVLYSSLFAVQGKGGFLDLGESEQKAVLLRVIGVEELERLAKLAREALKESKQSHATLMTRIKDEEGRSIDTGVAYKQFEEAIFHVDEAVLKLEASKRTLAALEERAVKVEKELAVEKARALAFTKAEAELALVTNRHDNLKVRLNNNLLLVSMRGQIESSLARDEVLKVSEERERAERAVATEKRDKAKKDVELGEANYRHAQMRYEKAENRAAVATERRKDHERVLAAAEEVEKLSDRLADAELDQSLKWELLDAERGKALDVAEKRVGVLRPAMDEIADSTDDPEGKACDAIAGDDTIVNDAGGATKAIGKAEAAYELASRAVVRLKNEIGLLERLAARAESVAQATVDLAEAQAESTVAQNDVTTALAVITEAERRLTASKNALEGIDARLDVIETERGALSGYLKKRELLAVADGKIAELQPQVAELGAQVEKATAAVEHLRAPEDAEMLVSIDLKPAKLEIERLIDAVQHARAMVAVAEARTATAKERDSKLRALGKERRALEDEIADFMLLADSLGRDGLQALEIDAAGPELTEMINDLLQTCLGPRWSVWVATTRMSDEGKQLEDLSLRVLDSESGREGSVDSLSGGEKVLVGEAIALALTMLACRRAGVLHPTLIRDESGAALHPDNVPVYAKMLRHAAEVVGASHVIFVSHNQQMIALADAVLEFDHGEVRLVVKKLAA